jgi:hypothetical protein
MNKINVSDDGVQSPSLRHALKLISGATLSTLLLNSCGDSGKENVIPRDLRIERKQEVVTVDELGLENPFASVDRRQMANFHTPWLEPMRSPGRFHPILIPGQDSKIEKHDSQITTKHISSKKELQNTWDNATQTMTVYFPSSKADLGDNDWRDIAALVKHYKSTGASLKRIRIK